MTQVCVSVFPGTEIEAAVVKVPREDLVETYHGVEYAKCRRVGFWRANIVAGCVEVAAIETDTKPLWKRRVPDDVPDLTEFGPDDRALSCCCFESDPRPLILKSLQAAIEVLRYLRYPSLHTSPDVGSGMDDENIDTECLSPSDLVDKALKRFPSSIGLNRREVDEIGGVAENW